MTKFTEYAYSHGGTTRPKQTWLKFASWQAGWRTSCNTTMRNRSLVQIFIIVCIPLFQIKINPNWHDKECGGATQMTVC
jgi:hypothetical protein